ncbi:MAG: hypothetical protein FJ137_23620 [Deltaproteobacteria bacterium]|nr:hypothetical protein [Deltaproteobacteria bacterium]
MKLDRRGTGRSQALPVVDLAATTPVQPARARYVRSVGDVAVEFDDACSGETLARVVRALRTC